MKLKIVAALAALTLCAGTGVAAAAIPEVPGKFGPGLKAVGPTSAVDGFPVWYKDKNGLRLQNCLDINDTVCPPMATPGGGQVSFPGNYPGEGFYTRTSTTVGPAFMEMQLEQAFSSGEVAIAGDQVTFARVRYRIDAQANTSYKITSPTTPAGGTTFVTDEDGSIDTTEDIGLGGPVDFSGALGGRIGPFLTWSDYPASTGLPNILTGPNAGQDAYIGDPRIAHAIKGSPYDTNFYRIEGPNIAPAGTTDGCPTLDGLQGRNCLETTLFNVQGKLATVAGVTADQVTYSRTDTTGGFLDVFASTEADNPYVINVSGLGFATTQLTGSQVTVGNYFAHVPFTGAKPATVSVINATDASPASIKVANVVDRVSGTAVYNPATGLLTVNAASSDTATPLPVLTASGFAVADSALVGGTLTVPVAAPPLSVTVTSDKRGSAKLPVTIGAPVIAPPVANAGPDQTVSVGELVTLNGSATTGVISWTTPGILLTNPTTATPTFTATTPGSYIFAMTVTGPGGSSTSAVQVTVIAVPTAIPDAPTDLAGTNATDTSITLNWLAPANIGATSARYAVASTSDNGATWAYEYTPLGTPPATTFTLTGLTPGTPYLFGVVAINSAGWGAWSANAAVSTTGGVAITLPEAPTDLAGTDATDTSITLNWLAPANIGAASARYAVASTSDNGATWAYAYTPLGTPPAPTYTVTGLTPGTPYLFAVVAINSAGWGAWSANAAVSTTGGVEVTLPEAPTDLAGTNATATSITLNWMAPANIGAASARYAVASKSVNGATWTYAYTPLGTPPATTFTVTGLTPSTSYLFCVVAINPDGWGAWSANATVSTLP